MGVGCNSETFFMQLIILFGPPAVGKMTVGQELAKITDLKLFHNHLSLELVNQFFDFGTPSFVRLDRAVRFAFFEEIARSELSGLIFTYVWDLSEPADTAYLADVVQVFRQQGAAVRYIELKATLAARLVRNRDGYRLAHKPSKRDTVASEASLRYFEQHYRMNTVAGELAGWPLLTVDNTVAEPSQVAQEIKTWLMQPCP